MHCGTEVGECAMNNGGCSPDAICTKIPGSVTCTCVEGYSGDGFICTGKFFAYKFAFSLDCLLDIAPVSRFRNVICV